MEYLKGREEVQKGTIIQWLLINLHSTSLHAARREEGARGGLVKHGNTATILMKNLLMAREEEVTEEAGEGLPVCVMNVLLE